jgi:hypothetical protein
MRDKNRSTYATQMKSMCFVICLLLVSLLTCEAKTNVNTPSISDNKDYVYPLSETKKMCFVQAIETS